VEHPAEHPYKDALCLLRHQGTLCINNVGFIGLKDCGKVLKKPDFGVISSGDTLLCGEERRTGGRTHFL
jgi:hypothetical protein